jgi:hypothetical protein
MTLMSDSMQTYGISFGSPIQVRIRILGGIPGTWHDRMADLSISTTWESGREPTSLLSGRLEDQAALIGVLNTLHGLHLPLLSIDVFDERSTPVEDTDHGRKTENGENE